MSNVILHKISPIKANEPFIMLYNKHYYKGTIPLLIQLEWVDLVIMAEAMMVSGSNANPETQFTTRNIQ